MRQENFSEYFCAGNLRRCIDTLQMLRKRRLQIMPYLTTDYVGFYEFLSLNNLVKSLNLVTNLPFFGEGYFWYFSITVHLAEKFLRCWTRCVDRPSGRGLFAWRLTLRGDRRRRFVRNVCLGRCDRVDNAGHRWRWG